MINFYSLKLGSQLGLSKKLGSQLGPSKMYTSVSCYLSESEKTKKGGRKQERKGGREGGREGKKGTIVSLSYKDVST